MKRKDESIKKLQELQQSCKEAYGKAIMESGSNSWPAIKARHEWLGVTKSINLLTGVNIEYTDVDQQE